jgi:hypothetical protein
MYKTTEWSPEERQKLVLDFSFAKICSTADLVDAPDFQARDGMRAVAFEYIEVFCNRERLHSTLDYRSSCQLLSDGRLEPQRRKE